MDAREPAAVNRRKLQAAALGNQAQVLQSAHKRTDATGTLGVVARLVAQKTAVAIK